MIADTPGERPAQPLLRVLLRAVKGLVEIVVGAIRLIAAKDADQPLVRAAWNNLADAVGLRLVSVRTAFGLFVGSVGHFVSLFDVSMGSAEACILSPRFPLRA